MILKSKQEFVKEGQDALHRIHDTLCNLESFDITTLNPDKTVLVIVDMINGFVKEGLMSTPRIRDIINPIVKIKLECDSIGIPTIAFADCHKDDAAEFLSYPAHCLENSSESEIIDELKNTGVINVIQKNSTNGFIQPEFGKWLENNPDVDTFIVVGDCTDICVEQFVIMLKTWFNMHNMDSKIIVPLNAVETYDDEGHNATLMNAMSICSMMQNGVVVAKNLMRG